MVREIVELGNPVLRGKAAPVTEREWPELPGLIRDLLDTMDATGGVGIAAPQIGVPLRVFIVAPRPNDRYPDAPLMEPVVMVNPVLEWASESREQAWEGCLSIPGLRAPVPRSRAIRVRYLDPKDGREVVADLEGFVARIWQHEHDHLEGRVFPDRVGSTLGLVTEKEYRRILQETRQQ